MAVDQPIFTQVSDVTHWVVDGCTFIIAVIVLFFGNGIHNRREKKEEERLNDKIQLAIQKFEDKLDHTLNQRFDQFVDSKALSYQLDLLRVQTVSDIKRLDQAYSHLNLIMVRNSEMTAQNTQMINQHTQVLLGDKKRMSLVTIKDTIPEKE